MEKKEKNNKIQVSSSKQPVRFYVNLCKKMLKNGEKSVEFSGLGNSMFTVVTCIEILKLDALVEVKKIETSTISIGTPAHQKPKILIAVEKSKNFDEIVAKQDKLFEEKKKKQLETKK
eukprot:EC820697.1.p1 GENE.EC820697.1~~EC820697.1.p1  ORF type:complete len:118 (+),score=64.66 EC820697.1:38-391(+)